MFSRDLFRGDSRRLVLLGLILTFGFAVIVGQLVRYQVVMHTELREASDEQVTRMLPVTAKRGYVADAQGHLLAMDVVQWNISASPPLVNEPNALSETLSRILDVPTQVLYAKFTSGAPWVQIMNRVAPQVGEAVADLHASGITCDPLALRVYPEGELTAHIIGIVNHTGEGFYGVEGYYNQKLKPIPGEQEIVQASTGDVIPGPPLHISPAQQGLSLILTVDLNIQYIVQQELLRALDEYDAESGTVLVMDPRTGAVLASVSYPSYDPNNFAEADISLLADPSVSRMWEPGSIFKIITWAAGLDSGTISANTQFNDTGRLEVGGQTIVNSDRAAHGLVTMEEGLLYSLNTAAAFVSTSMGKETFYNYTRRFGFGDLTDVDLSSEGPGMVKKPGDSNWFPSDLGTNSFGQGIAVTPMQMISAASAIANKGLLMKPYIVQEMLVPDDGQQGYRAIHVEPSIVRRAISQEAASTLTEMLVNVTELSSSKARVPGYRIAGKTGTAQIPIAAGYHPRDTIHSFVGYAPADDPQMIVLVKLDRPKAANWGADTAAPTFGAIAQRLLLYLQIPPDEIRLAKSSQEP